MENYKIIELRNEPYNFLIIATSYVSPLDSVDNIIKKVGQNNSNLLFDLTLINGIKKNRYIEMKYSKDTNLPKFNTVDSISPTIKDLSNKFFTSHYAIVDKSIVPNALKFLIKNSCV